MMDQRITDEPPGSEPWGDVPPWELPGGFRLDAEPHRGRLLRGLGIVAVAAGAFLPGAIICAPVALGLGLAVWTLARRDLERIRRGLTDPDGANLTNEARELGVVATGMGACILVPMAVFFIDLLLDW
jgi:hypothetical protein